MPASISSIWYFILQMGHTKNRPHDHTPWTTKEPDSSRLITTAHARLSVINGQRSWTIINGLRGAIRPHATTTHTWNYGAGVVFPWRHDRTVLSTTQLDSVRVTGLISCHWLSPGNIKITAEWHCDYCALWTLCGLVIRSSVSIKQY